MDSAPESVHTDLNHVSIFPLYVCVFACMVSFYRQPVFIAQFESEDAW